MLQLASQSLLHLLLLGPYTPGDLDGAVRELHRCLGLTKDLGQPASADVLGELGDVLTGAVIDNGVCGLKSAALLEWAVFSCVLGWGKEAGGTSARARPRVLLWLAGSLALSHLPAPELPCPHAELGDFAEAAKWYDACIAAIQTDSPGSLGGSVMASWD